MPEVITKGQLYKLVAHVAFDNLELGNQLVDEEKILMSVQREKSVLLREIDTLQYDLKSMMNERNEALGGIRSLSDEVESLKIQLREERQALLEKNAQLATQLRVSNDLIDSWNSKCSSLEEKVEDTEAHFGDLRVEVQSLQEILAEKNLLLEQKDIALRRGY